MSEASAPRTTWQVAEDLLADPAMRSKLKAFAYKAYGIRAEEAEDLLQDSALELLHHEAYVRKPEGYVFTVFKSKCVRNLGQRIALRQLLDADQIRDHPDRDVVSQADGLLALQEGFREISLRCRRLLTCYFMEGRSLRETAYDSSLSPTSVFKLVSRCLRRLRRCLSQ